MAEFWAEWGMLAYAVAAAWAFCEGETFVLFAAAAGAATGLIDPWLLILSVWGGSFAGDQLWFALGRRYGPRALRRVLYAERRLASAGALLERHGALFVLSFRFVYGVRNVAAAACGVAGWAVCASRCSTSPPPGCGRRASWRWAGTPWSGSARRRSCTSSARSASRRWPPSPSAPGRDGSARWQRPLRADRGRGRVR